MNTSLKPWVQYWIYSWLGVPKTAVGGWKCCQQTSGLLRTKHKPEKYRAYAAQVQISPDAILSLNVVFSSATGDPKLSFKANGSCGPPF